MTVKACGPLVLLLFTNIVCNLCDFLLHKVQSIMVLFLKKINRLDETTYTIDEVTEMLDGLLSVVRGEVEGELDNTAYTNVLLLRQMFQQAEKWHLKLQADISELENRYNLLNKIERVGVIMVI